MAEPTYRDQDILHEQMIRDRRRLAPAHWSNSDIDSLLRRIDAAREEGRREAIEECATIADGGAALLDGIEIKFVTPGKLATDLAKDIADGIRSLGKDLAHG